MLVLSRKVRERIVIVLPDGREIWITVVEIRGTKVRLGITAPDDIPVHRESVFNALQAQDGIRLHTEPGHAVRGAA